MAARAAPAKPPLLKRLKVLAEAGLARLESGKSRTPDLKAMVALAALLQRIATMEDRDRDHAKSRRSARRIVDDARREALAQRIEALFSREQNKKTDAVAAPRGDQ